MKIKLVLLLFLFKLSFKLFSQESDGYWDYERKTEKFIPLPDGNRYWVRVAIPTGTTQIIFRISFLSHNSDLRTSLASTLSSIPSASAQGIAATVSLLDKFGGDNKGKFHIFTSQDDANAYYNTGTVKNACYSSGNEIPSEKSYLIINESSCLDANTKSLYFAFFNQNYVDDEQVAIEVMPWIDNKASRGWTKEFKETIYSECVKNATDLTKAGDVCQCIVEKLQSSYKVQDFQNMSGAEQNKAFTDIGEECMKITGEDNNQLDKQRDNAQELANKGEYGQAIPILLEIISSGKVTTLDYNNIGYYYILTKQYLKAIKYLEEGEKMDKSDLLIKGNLAHAHLLNGDIEEAKALYIKYKTQNVTETMSWVQMVKLDFETFKKQGLPSENFESIINSLN